MACNDPAILDKILINILVFQQGQPKINCNDVLTLTAFIFNFAHLGVVWIFSEVHGTSDVIIVPENMYDDSVKSFSDKEPLTGQHSAQLSCDKSALKQAAP